MLPSHCMGLHKNYLQENVRPVPLSSMTFYFFWTILEILITVDVPLSRSNKHGFLKSIQYRLFMNLRGKSVTERYRALPALWSWGTGLWALEAQGESRLPLYLCCAKLPFIWSYNCSLALYERRKPYVFSKMRNSTEQDVLSLSY